MAPDAPPLPLSVTAAVDGALYQALYDDARRLELPLSEVVALWLGLVRDMVACEPVAARRGLGAVTFSLGKAVDLFNTLRNRHKLSRAARAAAESRWHFPEGE